MDLKRETPQIVHEHETPSALMAEPIAATTAVGYVDAKVEAEEPGNDFLSTFMEDSDSFAEVEAVGKPFDSQQVQQVDPHLDRSDVEQDMSISVKPILASRDLKQVFPIKEPREALALAAMPHYDLGGQNSIRMGHLEMRWLMADATVTIESENRASVPPGRDFRAEVEQGIQSLVNGGFIRPVNLTQEERHSMAQINEVLREDLPSGWESLETGVNTSVAFELTDSGIAAGRSVRNWDGNSPEAGLVRLPDGVPMPKVVASDAYDLSAAVMENRSLAGVLKPGEMGAYLQAEMATIEFGRQNGANPVVTIGRLDGLVDMASATALDQIKNGQSGKNAPLRPEDIIRIIQQAHRTLGPLPERVEVPALEDAGTDRIGLGKDLSRAGIARLEGVRIGTELIEFQKAGVREGVDLMDQKAWSGAVEFDKTNTLAIRDAIRVAKGWMGMVAEKGANIAQEVRTMSQGAFGAPGGVIADQVLARA